MNLMKDRAAVTPIAFIQALKAGLRVVGRVRFFG
jgi:hypothetical protein